MASSSPLECGVCNEKFNEEERCPRILPCYHHICSNCITLLIKNNLKRCPFCRKWFDAETAKDIRINTGVLDLITFITKQEAASDPNYEELWEEGSDSSTAVGLAYSTENASNLLLKKCRDVERLIDQSFEDNAILAKSLGDQNELISSSIIHFFEGIMSDNKDNMAELKTREERIMDYKKELKEKEEEIRILKEKLRTSDDQFTEDENITKEVTDTNDGIGVWITGLMEILDQDTDLRTKVTDDLDSTNEMTQRVVNAMTNSRDDTEDNTEAISTPSAPHFQVQQPSAPQFQVQQPSAPPLPRTFPQQFSEMNVSCGGRSSPSLCGGRSSPSLCGGRSSPSSCGGRSSPSLAGPTHHIDAAQTRAVSPAIPIPFTTDWLTTMTVLGVREIGTIRRYARITMHDEKLHVHALRNGPYSSTAYALQHEDLLAMDPGSTTVFFDIHVRGEKFGRMYIDLHPLTAGAKNFIWLCTGERGPSYAGSYAGSQFLGIHHQGTDREVIYGGDYEGKGGKGGKTLVSDLDLSSSVYKRKGIAGLVRGVNYKLFGQFYINTRNYSNTVCHGAIGKVISGLDMLQNAFTDCDGDASLIRIQDCGIVLNYFRGRPVRPFTSS